jgi:hypothetical protein
MKGCAYAIHAIVSLEDCAKVDFVVPVPWILLRNARASMQFDGIKTLRTPDFDN